MWLFNVGDKVYKRQSKSGDCNVDVFLFKPVEIKESAVSRNGCVYVMGCVHDRDTGKCLMKHLDGLGYCAISKRPYRSMSREDAL